MDPFVPFILLYNCPFSYYLIANYTITASALLLGIGSAKPARDPRKNKVKLDDKNALYQPVLDGKQLKSEPEGHKSGYVAIIGRPNAGKSTFLNAVLGQKLSIVTPKAQTTRHKILAILSEPEYQIVFLDTPGVIAKQMNKLEER